MTATASEPETATECRLHTDGAVLRAAIECCAKPSKRRPDFWATMVRVAPNGDEESYVEATNGKMLMRLTLRKPIWREGFITREIISRLKPEDLVVIDEGRLSVEEAGIDVAIREAEAFTLVNEETGERLRQWPDFDSVIPKGRRTPGAMIGLGTDVLGCVTRAAKHLSSPECPVALRMEAGGPMDPVKLSGLSIYGQVVFVVMPCSDGSEEKPEPKAKPAKSKRGRKA